MCVCVEGGRGGNEKDEEGENGGEGNEGISKQDTITRTKNTHHLRVVNVCSTYCPVDGRSRSVDR